MQTNLFPKLETNVSRLGFGAFGLKGVFGDFDEGEAIAAIHYCWEQGVNFIDMSLIRRCDEPGSGGRLALGEDAGEATAEHGREINEAIIRAIGKEVEGPDLSSESGPRIDFTATEAIWKQMLEEGEKWLSMGWRLVSSALRSSHYGLLLFLRKMCYAA